MALTPEQIAHTMSNRSVPELGQIILAACLEIKARNKTSGTLVSDADNAVNELYHRIESERFDAVCGWRLAKMLQNALRIRRNAKNDAQALNDLTAWVADRDEALRRILNRLQTKSWWEIEAPALKDTGD